MRPKQPFVAFWIFWYLLNLLPSSAIPLNDFMAEHRTYISNFGFAACAGYFLVMVCLPRIKTAPLVGVIVVLLGLYGYATIERNRVWATETTPWRDPSLLR